MANLGAVKRKLEAIPIANNPAVIEISDDESDEIRIVPPPSKRHKSATPTVNGHAKSSQSRERSHEDNPPISSTPSSSRVIDVAESKVKKSPWKRLSRFSYPDAGINRAFAPTYYVRQSPSTPPNGIHPHPQGNASNRQESHAHKASVNTRRTQSPRTKNHLPGYGAKSASTLKDPRRVEPGRTSAESNPRSRLLSVDIRTRQTPGPPTNGCQTTNGKRSIASSTQSPKPFSPKPSQSNIEIRIPSLLKEWTAPLPKSTAVLKAEARAQKRALLADLMISAEHAKQRPGEVLRHFGQTGFADSFSTEEDLATRRKLASRKKRTQQQNPRIDPALDISDDLIDSFDKLVISNSSRVTPEQSSRVILTNRFNEMMTPPLTFANDVNENLLNGKFQFTDRYIIRSGIRAAPPSTNYGCSCVGSCHPQSCQCFTRVVTDDKGKNLHTEQQQTYVRRPDGIIVLSDTYLAQELDPAAKHYEITECNEFCTCGPDCLNRVVGKGRTVPLEIFQTAKCGFGVRSSVDIVKGQLIELYLGEVITENELRRREDAAEEDESSYIYSLDWFGGQEKYHVDGQYHGSAMRFVNHCCVPNARCFTVQTHKHDKKVYYLAFFAIEDIPRGVEIRIDYHGGGSAEVDPTQQIEGEQLDDLTRCYCGEKKCRTFLWNPSATRRRKRRGGE